MSEVCPPQRVASAPQAAPPRQKLSLDILVRADNVGPVVDMLARASGLSKSRLKEVLQKGAVWLRHGTRRPQRLRRVTFTPALGDHLELHYDSSVIDRDPPKAALVADHRQFSVWCKPASLLVEGSRYGDHATLARQVETHFVGRQVMLVHRLDLEASGLVLVAHTKPAAAKLSELFSSRAIHKEYVIEIYGELGAPGSHGSIATPLVGKAARTDYVVTHYHRLSAVSEIAVTMLTGRYHQIRQHFASIGHAVVGDPKYGTRRVEDKLMRLTASLLRFNDPWTGEMREFKAVPPWQTVDFNPRSGS